MRIGLDIHRALAEAMAWDDGKATPVRAASLTCVAPFAVEAFQIPSHELSRLAAGAASRPTCCILGAGYQGRRGCGCGIG